MKERTVDWKMLLLAAGAFVSYSVGSSFASGNELLQFFASYGTVGSVASIIAAFTTTLVYCLCFFLIGRYMNFANTSEEYQFFMMGKGVGKVFQWWTNIGIVCTVMMMFSGAGSLFRQTYGLPQWVGSVVAGIVTIIVASGNFNKLTNVLGYAGVIMIFYIVIFGVISIVYPGSSFSQAAGVSKAVESGAVMQANLLSLFPLSLIPGLAKLNNPVLSGILYGTCCITTGFPFYYSLGLKCRNKKESVLGGILTPVMFYGIVVLAVLLMLCNFNAILGTDGTMAEFPIVAVVERIWPQGVWTYVLLIFVGIFTTASGMLWVMKDIFFHKNPESKQSKLFVVGATIFGMLLGSKLPFSVVINVMQPISGFIGLLMVILTLISTVRFFKVKNAREQVSSKHTSMETAAEK